MRKKSRIGRRVFLQDGVTAAAFGIGFSIFGLRNTLALARASGKSLLTEQSLNSLIPDDPIAFRALAIEAKQDLKTFIRKHFTLTPSQKRQLDALSREDIATIKDAIDLASDKRKGIRVKFIQPAQTRAGLGFMPPQRVNVPKPLKNVYVDGDIEPFKVVVGVKGKC